MFYDVILLNAALETEYRCKTIDFLWHSKLLEPGEYQIQIIAEDDLDLTVCRYVTVNTKKEIGIIQKWEYSSTESGTVIISGYFLEHLLFESVVYPTYNASNKTIWQVGAEVCSTYLDNLGFPLVLSSQPLSGVIVPESLSVTKEQTGDYVGTLLYDLAAVYGYGVSLTKVNKVPATNLLTNGDFSNGTAGWSTSTLASCTVSDNVAICLANSANDSINKTLSTVADHKYYFAARVKSTSNLIRFYLSNAQRYHSGSGNYELLSSIFTATSTNHGMGVLDSRLSGFDNFYVKYAIAIDLTATFGAGNEPTAAGMDALLSAFPNSWFDGTQELLPIKTLYNAKANKAQEDWVVPTLLNGWTGTLQYFKDSLGIVHFKGYLTGGTSNTTALQMPVGYRLSSTSGYFPIAGNLYGNVHTTMYIANGVSITPVSVNSATGWHLSSVFYRAEA